jgi:hypothetical protein
MTSTTKSGVEREGRDEHEPQPWRTDEDVRGWRRVGRAHAGPDPVGTTILVDVTPEEAAWLDRVGATADLTPSGVLRALLEQAQQAGWRPTSAGRVNGAP